MKKYLFPIYLLLTSCVVSCATDASEGDPDWFNKYLISLKPFNLAWSTDNVNFGAETNLIATAGVQATNLPWRINTEGIDWVSVTPTSGTADATIILQAQANNGVEKRVAVLKLSSTDEKYPLTRDLTLTQDANKEDRITPESNSLTLKAKAGTYTIAIASNLTWEASTDASWVTPQKKSPTELSITVAENTASARSATIFLYEEGGIKNLATITILQQSAQITGEQQTQVFEVDGGTTSITFESETSWTTDKAANWVTVSPESGAAGSHTLHITALPNASTQARSSEVYVLIGTTKGLAIPVSQDGISYTVSTEDIYVDKAVESTQTFTVEANASWEVVACPSWASVSPANGGKGTTTVTVTTSSNEDAEDRSGTIVIGREGLDGNKTINIKQAGLFLSDVVERLDFNWTSGTQQIAVSTNGAWIVTTDQSWIHPAPTSGTGNGTLEISVDANTAESERRGIVQISVGTTTQKIAVVQQGTTVNISCDEVLTNSRPCTLDLSIAGEESPWTATSDVDWLTLTPQEGLGNAQVQVAVADNNATTSRTGTVSVTFSDVLTRQLSFTQPGRTLSLSATELVMDYTAGTTSPIIITTDGKFSVTTDADSWVTLHVTNNSFYVDVTENTTNASRTATITVALTDLKAGETLERKVMLTQDRPDVREAVDLGLSVKWATCNIGAYAPEEYGAYFAWGETAPKSEYDWNTYKWCNGTYDTQTKYCTNSSFGTVDNKTTLEAADDAATANWGENWRMPIYDEMEELRTECTWTWTTLNGVKGYSVQGPTGKSIFLPAAGYRYDSNLDSAGSYGYYWTASLSESSPG